MTITSPIDAPRTALPTSRATDDAPAALAFQAALLRVARQGRGTPGDDEAAPAEPRPEPPGLAAQPLLAPPPPLQPAAEAPAWAPQPVRAPDALSMHLQAQAIAAPVSTVPEGRWQLQLLEPGLPVQRLDVQRTAAGPLQVVVTADAPAHTLPAERLRQRLAARGQPGTTLGWRQPSEPDA